MPGGRPWKVKSVDQIRELLLAAPNRKMTKHQLARKMNGYRWKPGFNQLLVAGMVAGKLTTFEVGKKRQVWIMLAEDAKIPEADLSQYAPQD